MLGLAWCNLVLWNESLVRVQSQQYFFYIFMGSIIKCPNAKVPCQILWPIFIHNSCIYNTMLFYKFALCINVQFSILEKCPNVALKCKGLNYRLIQNVDIYTYT